MRTDSRLQGPLFESPTFVLMQAGRLALEAATRALQGSGLSLSDYAALLLIRRFAGITQGAVAERLGISKASMSGLAIGLETRHLVKRRQHLLKPGSRALYVTAAGLELLGHVGAEFAALDARFRKCLGDDAMQALAELPPRELTPIELALRAADRY